MSRGKTDNTGFFCFSGFSAGRKSEYPDRKQKIPALCEREFFIGANDGNRTRISSLGSWCSATELHLRSVKARQPEPESGCGIAEESRSLLRRSRQPCPHIGGNEGARTLDLSDVNRTL